MTRVRSTTIEPLIREARRDDVPGIVALLADDQLGAKREQPSDPLPESYFNAFDEIATDPNNTLIVAEIDGRLSGVLQLTIIPGLTYRGSRRAQVEGVRVAADTRGEGIGATLLEWTVDRARKLGCHLVQLTTDKQRPDAVRFYEAAGFAATHEGMKRHLRE